MRVSVAPFDSDAGAVQARDLLHEEDLKQPCFAVCSVSPGEYEIDEIPDSAAVHQKPNEGKLPPGLFRFEAFHAEFVIGPRLYVLQMDGPPDSSLDTSFEAALKTVYEGASSG